MVYSLRRIHSVHYGLPGLDLLWAYPLSLAYGLAIRLWQWVYASGILPRRRLPVPVVSIGNLTTGGTGKTPVVLALAQYLEAQGLTVVVLSRGYGAARKGGAQVVDSPEVGDEAYLIQSFLQRGKVYVGRNRVDAGRKAIRAINPDVILLDDGFQHLPLQRDIDIVLVDGERGFGNGHLLPAGPLREPVGALKRAQWLLFTKTTLPSVRQHIEQLCRKAGVSSGLMMETCPFLPSGLMTADGVTQPLPDGTVEPVEVVLVSGIAQPDDFEAMVRKTGAVLAGHFIFEDHEVYTADKLVPVLAALAQRQHACLWTTQKDWVKLKTVIPEALHGRVRIFCLAPQYDWYKILSPVLPQLRQPVTQTPDA